MDNGGINGGSMETIEDLIECQMLQCHNRMIAKAVDEEIDELNCKKLEVKKW